MKAKELKLEVNAKHANEAAGVVRIGGATVMVTTTADNEHWTFRVMVSKKQAVVAFPKFMTLGVGFLVEKDWNTNLPVFAPDHPREPTTLEENVARIYDHIKHNRNSVKGDRIPEARCLEALRLVCAAVIERNAERAKAAAS